MPALDKQLIQILSKIAERGSNPAVITMLREMEQATHQGIDFEFTLYKMIERADPINFDGSKWNQDIMFMFAHFRVKPIRQDRGKARIEPSPSVFFDPELLEEGEGEVVDAEVVDDTPQLPPGDR